MDLKELEKFLKVCRKQGVTDIIFDGVTVKFGELPRKELTNDDPEEVATAGMSADELMFYHLQENAP